MSKDVHAVIALEEFQSLREELRGLARQGPRLQHVLGHVPPSNTYWRLCFPVDRSFRSFQLVGRGPRHVLKSWSGLAEPFLGWILVSQSSEAAELKQAREAVERFEEIARRTIACMQCLGVFQEQARFCHLMLAIYELAWAPHPTLSARRCATVHGIESEIGLTDATWYSVLEPDLMTATAAAIRTWELQIRSVHGESSFSRTRVPPPLDPDSFEILRTLADSPSTLSAIELAGCMNRNRKTVASRVEKLQDAGLVVRNGGNRGGLMLTEAGRRVADESRMPTKGTSMGR